MLQYGFPWPDILSCKKFPQDNDMCIKVVAGKKQPGTFEELKNDGLEGEEKNEAGGEREVVVGVRIREVSLALLFKEIKKELLELVQLVAKLEHMKTFSIIIAILNTVGIDVKKCTTLDGYNI
ncbi:unnamed protein product [Enterobius vermicularis]|uniref:Uncharacterized protein n=1 Tax=Enterobius vermicularis TaxID=51028 RepID=A0A0N4V4U8_ENTVE|nr:unnamed protein product [Enterobius vermicularis]